MLYIPPTQNPFLMQSMNLLQNIGMMYLGHNLKQQDQEKQQEYMKYLRGEEGSTRMQERGYTPATEGIQRSDAGGAMPEGQMYAYGQTWKRPESKKPEFYDTEIEGVKIAKLRDETGKTKWEVITAPKTAADKQPSSFIQKYLVAKSQGYTGDIMQFQKEMYKMAAGANPSSTPKEPNSQLKLRKFIEPKTGKYMAQEMVFNPKTKAHEPAKDKDGNPVPPYEIPKTFDLMGSLLGGAGQQQTSDGQLDALNKQIEALQNALKEEE